MVLPLVRHGGREPFYSAERPEIDDSGERRNTRYSDVCGSVDEFKRHVAEGPRALREHDDEIAELFDDIRHMIGRMYRRQREYTAFTDRLRALIERLEAVPIVDRAPADEGLAELERMLAAGETGDAERLNESGSTSWPSRCGRSRPPRSSGCASTRPRRWRCRQPTAR